MTNNPKWKIFQDYIASRLSELDQYCRSTKGSGNKGEKGDVKNSLDLHIECKQRATKSVTINNEVWNKVCTEIPLHVQKVPLLALENKEGKRWAVLQLDDFITMYIDYYKLKNGVSNVRIK